MDLEEAYILLERIYLESQQRDVRDERLIEAFRLVQERHPDARRSLAAYWRALKHVPGLTHHQQQIRIALCVPLLNGVWNACRRRWTVGRGWVQD